MNLPSFPLLLLHLLLWVFATDHGWISNAFVADSAAGEVPLSCPSWQFAVETNNLRGWKTVPATCQSFVKQYMTGDRYREDSSIVVDVAIAYALQLQLSSVGSAIWIFDVDETALSNVAFFSRHSFGGEPLNLTLLAEWVAEGNAPALPETLRLYKVLLSLGIKTVFITSRTPQFTDITIKNLKKAGYDYWEKLILKDNLTETSQEFKSAVRAELTQQGFRILGNFGDEWSDLLGSPEGERTFKLPNPMYYTS